MAKSEKEQMKELLYSYFKVGNKTIKKNFEEELLSEDGIELQNYLLAFLSDELENIIHEPDTTYLFEALRYIEIMVEKYPDLNRKKIKKKLRQLVEKLDRISQERKSEFYSARKVKQKIRLFNELVSELEIKLSVTKNKYYGLLEYFIFETQNIEYIDQILKTFPTSVNVKNESHKPIFYEILTRFIEKINDFRFQ